MITNSAKVGIYIGSVAVLCAVIAYLPPLTTCGDTSIVAHDLMTKIRSYREKASAPNISEVEVCTLFRNDGIPLMKFISERLEIYKKCRFDDTSGEALKQDLEEHFEAMQWSYAQDCAHDIS